MRKQNIILTVLFLTFVFLLPVLFFVNRWVILDGERNGTNFEKRTPAPFPHLSLETIGQWPDAMEEYFRDHLPLRHSIIAANAKINYDLFYATTSTKVVLGKENWAFFNEYDGDGGENLADYQGIIPMDETMLAGITTGFQDLYEAQREIECTVIFLMPPNKEQIYAEYLPDGIPQLNSVSRADILYNRLQSEVPGLLLANPKQQLIQTAKTDKALYYRSDTHWSEKGAFIGAISVLDALQLPHEAYSEKDYTEPVTITGDLYSLGGLDITAEVAMNRSWQDGIMVTRDSDGVATIISSDAADTRSVLILGDSFRYNLQTVLPHYFANTAYMAFTDASAETIQKYNPDILIVEQVERNIGELAYILPKLAQ